MTKEYKTCQLCLDSKSVVEFYRRTQRGYLSRYCKPCTVKDNVAVRSRKRASAREAKAAEPAPTEQTCTACGQVKPIEEGFGKGSRGWFRRCRSCRAAYDKRYKQDPKVRRRASEYDRGYRVRNSAAMRRRQLARYGIQPEDYDERYQVQRGRCLICDRERLRLGSAGSRPGGIDVLGVDHDHKTGAVRGLLCSTCNRALGLLGDNIAWLKAAIAYLEEKKE